MTAAHLFCELSLFAVEQLKMFIACFLIARQKSRKPIIITAAITAAIVLYLLLMQPLAKYTSLLRWVFTFLVCVLAAESRFSVPIALFSYPAISMLDMTVSIPAMYFTGSSMQDVRFDSLRMLCINSLSIPLLLMVAVAVRMFAPDWKSSLKGKTLILFLTILLLLGVLETVVLLAIPILSVKRGVTILMSLFFANIMIFLLYSMLLRSDFLNSKLTLSNSLIQKQMELQKQYYIVLLEKEEETKRFRHDFKNHLSCMTALLNDGQIEQLRDYLTDLNGEMQTSSPIPQTGNHLLDAIVWDQMHAHNSVSLECDGLCPKMDFLSDVEFCTIFSNVFSNAFEAAEFAAEHRVTVRFRTVSQNLLVTVSNTAVSGPKKKRDRYISRKTLPNHGYGLQNILQCLEQHHAQYSMEFKDGIYTMNICFLNINAPFTAV